MEWDMRNVTSKISPVRRLVSIAAVLVVAGFLGGCGNFLNWDGVNFGQPIGDLPEDAANATN